MNNNRSSQTEVLIVGAGPTGLTLACDLARRGIAVRIIDKSATLYTGSRGKGIDTHTLEIFSDLGIASKIMQSAIGPLGVRHYPQDKTYDTPRLEESTPLSHDSYLLVPQWTIISMLHKQLGKYGVKVEMNTELTVYTQSNLGVTASLLKAGQSHTVHAQYLVGCDGEDSRVRSIMGAPLQGDYPSYHPQLVGDVTIDGLSRDAIHVWYKNGNISLIVAPMLDSELWHLVASADAGKKQKPSIEYLQQVFEQETGMKDVKISDPGWLMMKDKKRTQMVTKYQDNRIFLAGNAAHIHAALGGQDLNLGVQDAYNLGWKLASVIKGIAHPDLLTSYQEERLPATNKVLGWGGNCQEEITLLQTANAAQRTAKTINTAQAIHYRQSRLTAQNFPSVYAVQAGDRAPDVVCENALTGDIETLHQRFNGPHFTILVFCGKYVSFVEWMLMFMMNESITLTDWVQERFGTQVQVLKIIAKDDDITERTKNSLIDTHGTIAETYGAQQDTVVIVRPDGYIGMATQPGTINQINDYFNDQLSFFE